MSASWGMLIVADDLTGATDCAGRLVTAGTPVRVVFGDVPLPPPRYDGEVVTRALDARHESAAECRRLAREATLAGIRQGYETRFVKVDSALRGNPAALIAGVRSVTRHELAVVAPAFPAQRRWTRRGIQEIGGAGDDARSSRFVVVASRVAPRRHHRVIDVATVRAGWRSLASELRRTARRGCDIVIADAETEEDLETIAAAALQMGALLVGSAGLAAGLGRVLAGRAGPRGHAPSDRPVERAVDGTASAGRGVLIAAGTHHPVTRSQIEALRERGVSIAPVDPVAETSAAAVRIGTGETGYTMPSDMGGDHEAGVARLARLLSTEGRVVAVPANWPAAWETRDLMRFGATVARAAERSRPALLALTGGDTALAVLTALGATELSVEREVAPGVPVARLNDGHLPGLRVVLKSGGFGDESALLDLL